MSAGGRRIVVLSSLAVLWVAALDTRGRATLDAQAGPRTTSAITYTRTQAGRGRSLYLDNCARCHADLDGAAGPALAGPDFRQNWFGQPVAKLFTALSTRMPKSAPGSLASDDYADITAYILTRNGLLAGNERFTADASSLQAQLPWQLPQGGGEVPPGLSIPALPPSTLLDGLTPVTDALLTNPPPSEWLAWRRTPDAHGFSPLATINRGNVATLRVAWSWLLPVGPNEITPLFHDGVLFVQANGDKVQALDAGTGDLLWQYSPRPVPGVPPVVKRAIALYEDKLYLATTGGHVIALTTKDGKVVWDRALFGGLRNTTRLAFSSGPLIARGKVMIGSSGTLPGGNVIVGLDARSGDESWRVFTVARPDGPGGNSWNGLPLDKRSGGSVWVPGSYDATLGLAFFGAGPTYDTAPLLTPSADPGVSNDALYTDSTLAIDPDTGRMVWHYQHLANDQWDLDWALERVLFTLPGRAKPLVATAGKQGIYDVLEADRGTYAFSIDLGLQDIVTAIDPRTGAKTIDRAKLPASDRTVTACPHSVGAKSWIPESFNPNTRRLIVPLNESCMDMLPVAPGARATLSTNVRWMLRPRPGSDGNYGRLQAIDLEKRTVAWTHRQRSPYTTGVLATAGGLVFAGGLDRRFAAYDDSNGRELWSVRLNDVPNGAPMTFMNRGRQFVALTVGNGAPLATTFPMLVPELKNPLDRTAGLWVFELPAR